MAMKKGLSIGQVSAASGVPVHTIRYYEAQHLLAPLARVGNGRYRCFSQADVELICFVKQARRLLFTLAEIRTMLELRAQGLVDRVLALLREKVESLKADARRRREASLKLGMVVQACSKAKLGDPCQMFGIADKLGSRSAPGPEEEEPIHAKP